MKETAGYGQGDSPYYSEEEQRSIAAIATAQGAIGGDPMDMADLFANYSRMALNDVSDMTMYAAASYTAPANLSELAVVPEVDAQAILMANLAATIFEHDQDQPAEQYIGTGSIVHEKAVAYLPLVLRQRGLTER